MEYVLEQTARQMLQALKISAETKGTMTSPTQWAKRQNCWEDIKQKDFKINEGLISKFTISTGESKEIRRENVKIQREYDELKDYIQIVSIKPSGWTEIHEYTSRIAGSWPENSRNFKNPARRASCLDINS